MMWKKLFICILTLAGTFSVGCIYYNYRADASTITYSSGGNVTGRINQSPSNFSVNNSGLRKGDKFYLNVDNPKTGSDLEWVLIGADDGVSGIAMTREGIVDPMPISNVSTNVKNDYADTRLPSVMDPFISAMQAADSDFLLERPLEQINKTLYLGNKYNLWAGYNFYTHLKNAQYITGKSPYLMGVQVDTEWTTGAPEVPVSERKLENRYHVQGSDLQCDFGYWNVHFGHNTASVSVDSIKNQWVVVRNSGFPRVSYTDLNTVRHAAHIDLSNIVFGVSQGTGTGISKIKLPSLGSGNLCSASSSYHPFKLRVYDPSLTASLTSIKDKNKDIITKVVENKTVYLDANANSGTNHTVSALIFSDSGSFEYYIPLDVAKGFDLYELDLTNIPAGIYKIGIVNEIYDDASVKPAGSSLITDVKTLEIVKPVSITAVAETGLEVNKNVNQNDAVATYTTKDGIDPITVTLASDTSVSGHSNDYMKFNVSGNNIMVNDPSGLHAGDYYFKLNAVDVNGDPSGGAETTVHVTVNKTNLSVAFDDPNPTKKSIAEATTGWNETATATPSIDTKITYAKNSGSVALINIDPDSGKITYAGSGGYGKVIIKATADDDPTSGYDDYYPSDTTKEIIIYREVDGTITPHTNSSSTTSPTFQTSDVNIKPNGIIGTITGILGTPDDGVSGNTTYTYGLKNEDDYNFFDVNPTTGEIKTTADLSTTTGTYHITVTVSDKWSTKEMAVTITVGLAGAEDLKFYENSTSNTIITTKSAKISDTGVTVFATVKGSDNTNPVTYQIKDGSTNIIEVHPTSGAITIHGVGTVTIVATKKGASGQADAQSELTFTVTAGEQDFIYTDASKNKLPQTGNKYNEYKETYASGKTFQLYTDGNPPGSSVTYQLKADSANDVITVDSNGLVHILNASLNHQIGKVIVEATSHDPSGNYTDKTIELPITIEKGTRVIEFAEDPIYVVNGSGSVVPNILTDGILDTDNDITIEVDSNENGVAWTNDGVTIQYTWNEANGKDIMIHAIKQDDRNYKVAETDGILHILGADERALSLSTPGKIIYGDHFVIKSTQNDSMSKNVQYTFETDNGVFISAPQVTGNKAEFDALANSGNTQIKIKVTRTADGEMPLSKTVTIKVLPKPITIQIDDKEKKRLEENPPLTFQDFTSQLVSWGGVRDTIDTSHIKLSTTAKKYSPIGSYPITSGDAQKQLNDNYPNYTITIKEGLLNVIDNGNKDFWDIDDDGCPDLNIKFTDEEGNEITINGDLNDDGIPDYNIDTNGDGKPDLNIDTDKDGRPDINLVMLKEWKPTKCVTLGDISFSSGINAKAEINIDLNDDQIPDINIDNKGDFKPHLNISKDGKTPFVNITEMHTWEPIKDYEKNKFLYDSIGEDQEEYKPTLNIDSDDDGRPDINIDLDGDGEADINIDIDLDGIPDIDIDSDGDGKPDINIDTNGDGKPDENIREITEWKPEHNVDEPFGYDTMIFDEPNDNPPNSEVNGSYYPGANMGGALTGDDTNIVLDLEIVGLSFIVLMILFVFGKPKTNKAHL